VTPTRYCGSKTIASNLSSSKVSAAACPQQADRRGLRPLIWVAGLLALFAAAAPAAGRLDAGGITASIQRP